MSVARTLRRYGACKWDVTRDITYVAGTDIMHVARVLAGIL